MTASGTPGTPRTATPPSAWTSAAPDPPTACSSTSTPPRRLDDGVAVIEWIAAQDWCTGAVGIFGISWGGFNGLQLAGRAPEALKAVVTVCSTDDRYDNDVHYMGGAVLGIDMAAWGATMFAFNSRPPRPEVVGEGWVERWRERLDPGRPMTPTWLAHQERDAYWRHGSVCEDYAAITAPVLAVGGWADPYRDAVLRLVENVSAPVKGIIGPWSHQYPDRGLTPGPSIGFLQETLRWWDRWLKGVDTGVEADPALRAFLSDSEPPATRYPERTGRWVAAPSWPPPASVAAQPVLPLTVFHGPAAAGDAVVVRSPSAPASTPAGSSPSATPPTCRRTSAPRTASRSASTCSSTSRSTCSGTCSSTSRSRATCPTRTSWCGSATSRPTAPPRS
ncbi:CocE/NonD family hydrolase [Clavibacter tessellarius]|uniref:CocE/NonD family hydrolase n=1 Tax=Clavibacter tessellarius TaxID=31965 RepID=UPI00324C76AD